MPFLIPFTSLSSWRINKKKLTAASFSEIRDRAEVSIDWPSSEPTVVQVGNSLCSIVLTAELDVHIAHQVIAQVVTNIHLFHFAVPEKKFDDFQCCFHRQISLRAFTKVAVIFASHGWKWAKMFWSNTSAFNKKILYYTKF